MKELIRETAFVANGSPDAIWAIIEDVDALARVLPGCEALAPDGDGRLRGVLAARIQFLTVRADVVASLHEAHPPRHLRVQLDGRPHALAGSFIASIAFDMEPVDGGTRISYRVDLAVTGRLAAFGLSLLRHALGDQIARLVGNLNLELAPRSGHTLSRA